MSSRTGGGFGGSYLAEALMRTRRPRRGELVNYLDWAHYERVQGSYRKQVRRAARLGVKPPQPQFGIPYQW